MSDHVAANLADVKADIAASVRDAKRPEASVRLVAVSKTFPPEDVAAAYRSGQRAFAENRIQELESKAPALPADIEWHLIGHLQSNKAAKAVELAAYIHAVDSAKLLERLDRLAGELGKRPKILLEVNVSGEESKFGLKPDELPEVARLASAAKHLDFVGLMTMAPFDADAAVLVSVFGGLRSLRNRLQTDLGIVLPELSMGMSSDFRAAIAQGSTMVRIGSALFGRRGAAR